LVSVTNMPELVCRKQLLEKKFKEKEAWMRKTLHWEWDVTSKAEKSNENQVCE
jgi:hypothetical protein